MTRAASIMESLACLFFLAVIFVSLWVVLAPPEPGWERIAQTHSSEWSRQ